MAEQTQKQASGGTVRIWREPKKRLAAVVEKKSEKEGRIVSEAELVSKAVEAYCTKEERKLGIA
jgi:hypothetical protein